MWNLQTAFEQLLDKHHEGEDLMRSDKQFGQIPSPDLG